MSNYAAVPKKTTSVSLAEPRLAESKTLGINVSQAAEEGLAVAVARQRREQWLRENRESLTQWNTWVEENGLPLAEHKMF